jgi:ribonuclease Z
MFRFAQHDRAIYATCSKQRIAINCPVLVQVADKRLLFDCGRGVVIRLTQAEVNPKEIDALFLTHLHSDHVVGIPDLWLSGWFLG